MKAGSRNRLVLGLVLLVAIPILLSLYVHKPPNPDQEIFDYIGWVGSSGGTYYKDVAEQNFPGEMLLHDLAIRIFGANIQAFRALDFLVALLGSFCLFHLLRLAGFGTGSYFGALFYLAGYVSSNAWLSGQRDIIAANLLLLVGLLFVLRMRGGRRLLILPLDAALFFAVLLRPTYLLFPVFLAAIDWALARRSGRDPVARLIDAALVAAGLALCAILMAAWGWLAGALPDFWQQAVLFNLQAYGEGHTHLDTLTRMASAFVGYAVFVPGAVLAVARAGRSERRGAPMPILLGLVGLAFVSAFVQNKGYGYHLAAMLPTLFGFCGVSAWTAFRALVDREGLAIRCAAGAAALLGLVGLLYQAKSLAPQARFLLGRESYLQMLARESAGEAGFSWADLYAAADYARERSDPNESVLVWGRPVSINVLAKRRSPSRFITHGMLILARPPFERWEDWVEEFRDAIFSAPPRFVFVSADEARKLPGERLPPAGTGTAAGYLRQLLEERYEPAGSFGSVSAYVLR